MASELVANAVRHVEGEDDIVFSLTVRGEAVNEVLRVAVHDRSTAPPRERLTVRTTRGDGGLGWPMVKTVCQAHGVDLGDDGKWVWGELPLHRD